jgi:hypothetical protein
MKLSSYLYWLVPAAITLVCVAATTSAASPYAWRSGATIKNTETLAQRIPPPPDFERVGVPSDSWAAWLRGLPLKPANAPVLLYNGAAKWRQDVHAAVIDIDVGKRDLQQCADAIMRLRGEWMFATGRKQKIGFNYTDGKRRRFTTRRKHDYASFKKYMTLVFAYAGTYSLERELKKVPSHDMQIGDVFIKGGFPGHAVLVADMVANPQTGEKRFLLIQSFMPAQEMHVLKNPASPDASPWYTANLADTLVTPEWTFPEGALHRWP